MVSVAEIGAQVAELVMRKISLDDFEDWFVSHRQEIHQYGEDEVKEFAYSVDSVLSQFDSDCEALRHALLEAWFSAQEPAFFENSYGVPPRESVQGQQAASNSQNTEDASNYALTTP